MAYAEVLNNKVDINTSTSESDTESEKVVCNRQCHCETNMQSILELQKYSEQKKAKLSDEERAATWTWT